MYIYIASGILLVLVLLIIVINNQIIKKENRMHQAFSSIDVYLKKRFDLIPNLISVVKKYAEHEKEILTKITELRSQSDNAKNQNQKIDASNEFTKLMTGLNVQLENYPNLKADEQFMKLQHVLEDIEEQLSAARRAYNAGVTDYNNTIQMFPTSILAACKKLTPSPLLEISEKERQNVDVKSLF